MPLPLPSPLPFPLLPLPLFRAAFDASCTEGGTAPVEPGNGLFSAGFGCGTVAFGSGPWSLEPDEPSCFFACPGGSDGVAAGAGSVTVEGGDATGTAPGGVLSWFFAWPGAAEGGAPGGVTVAIGVVTVAGASCFLAAPGASLLPVSDV